MRKFWQMYAGVSLLSMACLVMIAPFVALPWVVLPFWIALFMILGLILLLVSAIRIVVRRFRQSNRQALPETAREVVTDLVKLARQAQSEDKSVWVWWSL
jgi:uncharacterized membrane protein YhaH (DUF805 family)